jgi:hypothetical protein
VLQQHLGRAAHPHRGAGRWRRASSAGCRIERFDPIQSTWRTFGKQVVLHSLAHRFNRHPGSWRAPFCQAGMLVEARSRPSLYGISFTLTQSPAPKSSVEASIVHRRFSRGVTLPARAATVGASFTSCCHRNRGILPLSKHAECSSSRDVKARSAVHA